ncbi:MAG: family 16 glycoside hydrolase, partial [Planctomycetota bacterium]
MLTHYTFALFACLILFPLQELPAEKLLFEDRFEREESQERTEEIGGKWKTNSNSRADGNKQVDLKDGFIHVMRHPKADHAVSIVHPANYTNCRVEIRFKINDKKDDLGIDFADMKCKDVHAGHICKVFFRPNEVEIVDFKNGRMKKTYRDRLASGQVSAEEKQALKQWQHKANFETKLGQWHDAVVLMTDTLIQVTIDGELVAEFDSPGIGHANKDMIRFSARREVSLDDVAVYAFDVDESLPKTSKPVKHLFVAKLLLRKFEQVGISD